MSTAPAAEPALAPPPPPAPSLGSLRDLLLFLLLATALFPLVQFSALYLLVLYARGASPNVAWERLLNQVIERNQYNAFFAVPVQMTYYLLLLLLLYAVVRRRGLRFGPALALRALGPASAVLTLVTGTTLALVITMASVLHPPKEQLAIDRLMSTRAAAELVIVAAVLIAPLVEELLFRGYIYTLLEGLWGSNRAVVTSGLLFGAIHFPQLWPEEFQMALLCVVGLILSLTRARTGSTTASICLHFAYNGTLSALFLLSPAFRALPALPLPLLALLRPS